MTQPNGTPAKEREVISRTQWLVLFVAVVLAGVSIQMSVDEILSDQYLGTQEAAVFSAGKRVGVSENLLLVSFAEGSSNQLRAELVRTYGLKERGYIKELGVHQFALPGNETPEAVAQKLNQETTLVAFAEPDYLLEPAVIPDDPWYLNWQKDKGDIQAPLAWDLSTGSAGVTVAVADTGVFCSHEDLSPNCVAGANLYEGGNETNDLNGHGTAVSGIIGGAGNNGLGVAGGAWDVSLMPLAIAGSSGTASYSTIAKAITYAADRGARVVNNSYQSGGSSAVQKAAKYLYDRGGILVVSQGNYGTDSGVRQNQYIVSVGAVDASDVLYSWSSYGSDMDVVAPGCTGATTSKSGGYGSFCGTSAAAPQVSGLLALIFSINPELTPGDAVSILTSTAVDLGTPGADKRYGAGRIDMHAALTLAKTYEASAASPTKKGNQRP